MQLVQIENVIPKIYQDQLEAETSALAWFFHKETARPGLKFSNNYGGFFHMAFDITSPAPVISTINGMLVPLLFVATDKASVMSFVLAGYSTDEVGKALNEEGIAVRTGHHCAQPILRRMGLETTVRPSLAFYNTFEEIDRLVAVVKQLASQRRAG